MNAKPKTLNNIWCGKRLFPSIPLNKSLAGIHLTCIVIVSVRLSKTSSCGAEHGPFQMADMIMIYSVLDQKWLPYFWCLAWLEGQGGGQILKHLCQHGFPSSLTSMSREPLLRAVSSYITNDELAFFSVFR